MADVKSEEYTTSKKVVNHKTKQVETRVQRQIIMEDGKVIADSGPQIITRTKEDHKTEESENSSKKKNGDVKAITGSKTYIAIPGDDVVSEKIETHNRTREARQENLQYHDESIKELTGYDIHKKALVAPNELISIEDKIDHKPKGKLTHYSSKCQKVSDKEEVKETSRRDREGKITTETTRTHHHEEIDDDELPEDDDEVRALPEASNETTRKIEYYNDDDIVHRNRFNKERKYTIESSNAHETDKWVENHFGSESSGSIERSRTRAGGNKINIELTSSRRSPEGYRSPSLEHKNNLSSSKRSYSHQRSSSLQRQEQDYEHRERYRYNRSKDRIFKEDASVQASLSDEDSADEKYFAHRSRSKTRSEPRKTYYFGENEFKSDQTDHKRRDISKSYTSMGKHHSSMESKSTKKYFDHNNNDIRNGHEFKRMGTGIDYDDKFDLVKMSDNYDEGKIDASFKHEFKSSVNDKVINDTSTNESFHRYYKSPEEKLEAQKSFEKFIDKSFNDHFHQSLEGPHCESPRRFGSPNKQAGCEQIHHPIFLEDFDSGSVKKDPILRQRNDYKHNSTPPAPSKQSGLMDSNKKYSAENSTDKYGESFNLGTWTKSKSKTSSSKQYSSSAFKDENEWPDFSPLLSPNTIREVTNTYNANNYASHYENKRNRQWVDGY